MTSTPIKHVSDTALWVATYRARETERPDALFRDPMARILVGSEGERIAQQMHQSAGTAWSVVIRTCIIDEYVQEAIAGGVDTIINLGAGLDTRPYRMDLPADLTWIEVDYPNIIDLKEERLAGQTPRCRLQRIRLDLADAAQRRAFLAKSGAEAKAILILTEGVLPYLMNEHVTELGKDLRSQAAIKYWIADFYNPEFLAFMRRGKMVRQMTNAPFLFNPGDWRLFFAGLGWRPKRIGYLVVEGYKRKRRPPAPFLWRILGMFLPAERRKALSEMSGYALFEVG